MEFVYHLPSISSSSPSLLLGRRGDWNQCLGSLHKPGFTLRCGQVCGRLRDTFWKPLLSRKPPRGHFDCSYGRIMTQHVIAGLNHPVYTPLHAGRRGLNLYRGSVTTADARSRGDEHINQEPDENSICPSKRTH